MEGSQNFQGATDLIVTFITKEVRAMNAFGIKPYIVFDGNYLPRPSFYSNADFSTNPRDYSRAEPFKIRNRVKFRTIDRKRFPNAIYATIQELKRLDLKCRAIVAPNEADAQLAYMERQGRFKTIISSDGDFITYGCEEVLFDLNMENRTCTKYNKTQFLGTIGLNEDQLLKASVLAGCDYTLELPFTKLFWIVGCMKRHGDYKKVIDEIRENLSKCPITNQYEKNAEYTFLVTNQHVKDVEYALLVYKHMRVYDKDSRSIVHLTDLKKEDLNIYFHPDDQFKILGEPFASPEEKQRLQFVVRGDNHPYPPYEVIHGAHLADNKKKAIVIEEVKNDTDPENELMNAAYLNEITSASPHSLQKWMNPLQPSPPPSPPQPPSRRRRL